MEYLRTKVSSIENAETVLKQDFLTRYELSGKTINESLANLNEFFKYLKDDLFLFIEHPYVDKVYRDSYYFYFSTKNYEYKRNTIRISFFKSEIKDEDFRNYERVNELQNNYLGFLVLRPTFPFIIGRSIISPLAVKDHDFIICKVNYNATANAIKLDVTGFPHSSQDSETITCAETTIWSVMEYFGEHYAKYKPALPSEINKVLLKFSFERLLPSQGLTAQQISYSLREFGFGVKIYSKKSYKDDFYLLIKTYVESGIPVVSIIQNDKGIGHAQIIIGRRKQSIEAIDKLNNPIDIGRNVKIFDFASIDLDYIFIDDNHPPYQISKMNTPSSFYKNPKWTNCEITNFIVPLYPKIYLEAGEARILVLSFIKALTNELKLIENKDIILRTFLTSSRSYKNDIALNETLSENIKDLIIYTPMPKFIWISEISNKELMKNEMCNGVLILDATEPQINRFGIIACLVENHYITHNLNESIQIKLSLQPFKSYQNNLK